MKSRVRQQGKINHKKKQQNNIKDNVSHQLQQNSLNNISINNANNSELKQIIQKLIIKSRSLISSLEMTLKQLDEIRSEKDFWKNHYLNFKSACEKYIKSRGIAPFQYVNPIQKTVQDCNHLNQEPQNESHYRSSSLNNLKKNLNKFHKSPQKQKDHQNQSSNQITKIDSFIKHTSEYKNQQTSILKTVSKTVDHTFTLHNQQTLSSQKLNHSFKGIKLGGKNKNQTTISPIKLNIYDTKSKNNSNYRRKDSLQTKRVQLFSFVRNKNHQNIQNLEVKII